MNESLRLTPTDINDWFMDCDNAAGDHKIPHVILNDKLMTDALLGTIPIKAEHSYSLTSDGDSMPDSPSDGTKIEGESKILMFSRTIHCELAENTLLLNSKFWFRASSNVQVGHARRKETFINTWRQCANRAKTLICCHLIGHGTNVLKHFKFTSSVLRSSVCYHWISSLRAKANSRKK